MKVNIKLNSIREMSLAGYWTREDLDNLGGSSRDFVVSGGGGGGINIIWS